MVSRRRILSRSRDDLNLDSTYVMQEEEEDVWYQRDKLYKDHIQEVLDKWTQIDDEIWAKVIVLERNRRVAKAYARAPVLTVNGSDDGFDGFRIGLCGFDNPMRDAKTDEIKRHIGHGVKVKMDDQGNILVKRVSKSNVYVKSTAAGPGDETSIGNEILKMPGCALEMDKPVKLFDMKKFQQNVSRELRRAYPDRRRLECQCLSAVAFVKAESELLDCPIWVLIINVVAMDMLKSRLPPEYDNVGQRGIEIPKRRRVPCRRWLPGGRERLAPPGPAAAAGAASCGDSPRRERPSWRYRKRLGWRTLTLSRELRV
ncbi:Mothers against decapentaplegic 2 [Gryllus bimaculatus]|nr:Mothers against decapentaplegic 2 [Gryllus bimaculatus]